MKKIGLFLAMLIAAPMLAACSASCDCPKCPTTTIVSPPNHTTVIQPAD